jgi:predicted nucleic acid-binding protein
MIDAETGPVVYVDTNPFLYLIEGTDAEAAPVKELFTYLRERPGTGVTSELTLAEVLVKARLPEQRRNYLNLIVWSGMFDLRPVTREILIETASYRRVSIIAAGGKESMVKLSDAIHVVTAIRAGCTRLLSKDRSLRLPAGMKLVRPDGDDMTALIRELS